MKNRLLAPVGVMTLFVLSAPSFAQNQPAPTQRPEDLVQGTVKSYRETPDPGFAHNQTGFGRNRVEGSVPDYGNYCGPLPGPVCHNGGFNYVLLNDPFSPVVWRQHAGNLASVQASQKKGWPLQTILVRSGDGTPLAGAQVRFFETGYRSNGIEGVTDANGRFQIAVKRVKRSHRFVVMVPGYNKSRLDIMGKQIQTAEHELVMTQWGTAVNQNHQVALMGDVSVPRDLVKAYRKAEKALDAGKWDVAIAESRALIERWPVGTIEGSSYEPQVLLIQALQGAGETVLAERVEKRTPRVVAVDLAG